ncbi:MAG: glycosyltransferase family 2 protein [bacterium]|nr:glycosyltransferase family 2 protein [bacterium]
MKPVIAVYISHNRLEYVKQTLPALLAQDYSPLRIICVDNGSTDGTVEFIREATKNDPRVILRMEEENLGLGRALNIGLSYRTADEYFLPILDDYKINKRNFIIELINAFSYLPDAGRVAHIFYDYFSNGQEPIFAENVITSLSEWNAIEVSNLVCGNCMYCPGIFVKLGKFYDVEPINRWAISESGERLKLAGFKNYHINTKNVYFTRIDDDRPYPTDDENKYACIHIHKENEYPQGSYKKTNNKSPEWGIYASHIFNLSSRNIKL